MKKLSMLFTILILNIIALPCFAQNEEFFGIGAELFKDPFNNKVIITNVIPNSPTEKAGIQAGSELISVNNEKIKKICICEVTDKIRGEEGTEVKLVIRTGWRWKTYELKRERISITHPETNPQLEMYLNQIIPTCFNCQKVFAKEITDKFSRKYRKTILPKVNYWFNRRTKFEMSYNTCMTYSKNNIENCLINLLNRENQTTNTDKLIYKFLKEQF